MDAAGWGALAAWVTAGIYVGLGVFAWRQVKEARNLREEQSRPFVVVDFEPGFVFYLTIENVGRTMARDVEIEFDKPLETTLSRPAEIDESPLLREPIPSLAPGKRIRILFDQYAHRLEKGLPLVYDVELRYRGPTGKRNRMRAYEDRYRLDMGVYLGASPPPKGLPDLADELEKVRKEVHKWTDGISGLRVIAVEDRTRLRQRRRVRTIRELRQVLAAGDAFALVRWLPGKAKQALRVRGWFG